MKPETARALRSINQRFYEQHADHFDQTRDRAWPGWRRLVERVGQANPPIGRPHRVLDLGCGNGRFATFLQSELGASFRYLGIDSSHRLLEHARERCAELDQCRFEHRDLLEAQPFLDLAKTERFDLTVAFGLLHHVPGAAARHRLLESALAALSPEGLLCVSSWRLEHDSKFERRRVEWRDHPWVQELAIDLEDLDPHDHVLSFGGDRETVRYCHHVSDAEIDGWIDQLPATLVERFDSDGAGDRLNTYLVFRR